MATPSAATIEDEDTRTTFSRFIERKLREEMEKTKTQPRLLFNESPIGILGDYIPAAIIASKIKDYGNQTLDGISAFYAEELDKGQADAREEAYFFDAEPATSGGARSWQTSVAARPSADYGEETLMKDSTQVIPTAEPESESAPTSDESTLRSLKPASRVGANMPASVAARPSAEPESESAPTSDESTLRSLKPASRVGANMPKSVAARPSVDYGEETSMRDSTRIIPTAEPEPDQKQLLADFDVTHGEAFDPNSSDDADKMAKLTVARAAYPDATSTQLALKIYRGEFD